MTKQATIGMYWEGEKLSWLENFSILSFQQQGHDVQLYSTNKNLTDLQGVEILDPRDIVEFPRNIRRKAAPSFRADIFRLYLQKKQIVCGWTATLSAFARLSLRTGIY